MREKYDVIVFGGGTAGTVAAIQAARSGASTLLVEKNGMLGGTMTVGGINAPAHFFAWGQQIIGGIGWELVSKTLKETGVPVPSAEAHQPPRHIGINAAVFAGLCDEVVLEAGVELLFHAMPATVKREDNFWSVTICKKSGLQKVKAKVIIDATGDANVVSLADFEVIHGDVVQPATLTMHCSGYDVDTLDFEALQKAAEEAVGAGTLKSTDIGWGKTNPRGFLLSHGHNANHHYAPKADSSEGRTVAEVEARRSMLRMYRFFKKQPGLENFRIDWLCPETGIRETARIKGKKTVTAENYESGKLFSDALCYAFYPIDEHLNDGLGINKRALQENVLPTIPRGALLPANSKFLIVAGRCLASDREANSALRVECPCMAMGQGAGVMAALSASSGDDPENLSMEEIYAELRRHNAIVPAQ